jgi:hypothetical protein
MGDINAILTSISPKTPTASSSREKTQLLWAKILDPSEQLKFNPRAE